MKKYLGLIALLGGCLVANNALARDVSTIKQAKEMRDDARVTLEGKITSRAGDDDRYWLQDSTGKIRIDVDDDDEGSLIGRQVRIVGDVDKNDGRTEIDVDHLRILK
ncbi:YgiW/YdeI family stress tolerance OB fold protein [unidentified bacterial endosymbiont]|uniref:YgiW/YdeI family stress tolerance OB fold protein n=1 Tax=unidentified bacterial endosymbiont TaxID=2355 RepID=UPI00209CB996|nr:NirD/YgiW/YdeI family stress tolerance protein [unidentified bacterial endosymbiont]